MSYFSIQSVVSGGLKPSVAARRGDFKGSLGRTVWCAPDLKQALRWSFHHDLARIVEPEGPPCDWNVGTCAVVDMRGLEWNERRTLVMRSALKPTAYIFTLTCPGEQERCIMGPAFRSPLLPPMSPV